jgi:hypothetical protein
MNPSDKNNQSMHIITEKAPSFRTYNADGAWGMVNPSGNIQLHFFIDRLALPTSMVFAGPAQPPTEVTFPLDKDEMLVVREFQSSIVVTLVAAQQMRTVLDNFIRIAESMNKQLEEK